MSDVLAVLLVRPGDRPPLSLFLKSLSVCPRASVRLIVRHCDCGLAKWWGQQEFAIPQNVLEIVYGQTICWIGTFYSPMLPAICTIKYFFIFYIKKVSFLFLRAQFRTLWSRCLIVAVSPSGFSDQQLSSCHASLPSLQFSLLLLGRAADRTCPGLPASHC